MLPLPKSGIIKNVCHISDLHIRAGIDTLDPKITRFNEYEIVFKRIIAFLKNLNHTDMIICITGDIVHDKRKAGATCINLVNTLIKLLADIAPVYIIRGNHDYDQASLTKQDMLSSYMNGFPKNVAYLNATGIYLAGNVCFGLVAIQDVLKQGNTFGRVENLPEFPDVSKMQDDLIKIALFHGDVPKTYPIEWFKGYDYLLLGDLHNMQIYGSNNVTSSSRDDSGHVFQIASHTKEDSKMMWGYPGSTIQQNFGEPLMGHGFIMWNLETKQADFFHVNNDYGFITVEKGKEDSWYVNINNKSVLIEEAAKLSWLPKNVRVRIKSKNLDVIPKLEQLGFIIEGMGFTSVNNAAENNIQSEELSDQDVNIFNKPVIWCDYITTRVDPEKLLYKDWSDWINNPTCLIIDANIPFLQNDINERNKKIQTSLDDYNKAKELVDSSTLNHSSFSLSYMHWSYILCFKNDCYFDFKTLNGQVHCISGRNGFGKTSWLETICIALFGEGFPSRANKQYSASIIYMGKPSGSRAFTSILFEIDAKKYKIVRFFETQQQQSKLHSKDITLEKFDETSNTFEVIHSGKLATQAWIQKNLGTIQSFLTSCIMTQACDEDFFMRNSVMQKTYLDQQLRLESSTAFANLLKTASLAYDDISKKLNNIYEFKKTDLTFFNQSDLDSSLQKLESITQEISSLDITFKSLKLVWNSINERILSKGKNVLQSELDILQQQFDSIPADGEDLETLIKKRAVAATVEYELEELNSLEIKYGSYEKLQTRIEKYNQKNVLFKINSDDIDPDVQKITDMETLTLELEDVDIEKMISIYESYPILRLKLEKYIDYRSEFNPKCKVCMSWKKKHDELEKKQMCGDNIENVKKKINCYYRLEQLKLAKLESRRQKFTDISALWKMLIDKKLEKPSYSCRILDEQIEYARKRLNIEKNITEIRDALKVIDAYKECQVISEKKERLFVEQIECKQTIKNLELTKHNYQSATKIIEELSNHCDKFNLISATIKAVLSEFVKFKDWVLEEKIIPIMLSNVNKLLETMCFNHRPISLECIFENGGLNWRICDGPYAPPIEKASGFQKFVVGLAMRIVLGRLGVAGIKNTQLFMDEGFTACDTQNLCNVPDVLNKLLELYKSVIIVTHLDELKNEIRSFINIHREETGGSIIQFGRIQQVHLKKPKKK